MSQPTRILAVDDEHRGLELVARTLKKLGEVQTAPSGDAAWDLIQEQHFELVISDQRMPGMSGVELLTRVAELSPHTGRILITGYADLAATIESINKGRVHAYVTKPCPPDELRLSANAVLERVKLTRENSRLLDQLSGKNQELEEILASLRLAQQRIVEAERLSAIGTMAATIVHDFRGPLSVIAAAAASLDDSASPAMAAEIASQISQESKRINRMCEELLDVTRVSAGTPRRVEEDLDAVVLAAAAALSADAAAAGIEVKTDLTSGARLPLDEDRLRRAILNLGYNALDAMGDGGELSISCARDGEEALVSVRDTGPGIPEEVRDRLFEPFVTAGKKSGSGLGLAIVKKIVEEHGGRVGVGKAEGGGTVFEIHLPLRDDA